MQTYKEQQEAKGLIFVPFRCSHMVYFHRIAQAYNPNTIDYYKVDYYKVAGHWITQEEDQQRKKYERNTLFCLDKGEI